MMLKENQDNMMETEDHVSQIVHKNDKIELHEKTIDEKCKTISEMEESLSANARTMKGLNESLD